MDHLRDRTLSSIAEIQAHLPAALVRSLRFTPVGADTLNPLLARACSIYSPVFLPLFERDGDLWAVHLRPGSPWQTRPWVMLPHDAAEPLWGASCLRYLPAGLLIPPHLPPRALDAAWRALRGLVARIPGAVRPPKSLFTDDAGPNPDFRARIDPSDSAARAALIGGETDEEVQTALEALLAEFPDDPYVLTTAAVARAELKLGDPVEPARRALMHEVPLGLRYAGNTYSAESAPELLEVARRHAAPGIAATEPLAPLATSPYTDRRTAPLLRQIAEWYRTQDDDVIALNQLRNGAAVAAWTQTLDAPWCRALAEQAERVEPECAAAALALLAADVIGQGP